MKGLRIVLPDGSMESRIKKLFEQIGLPISISNKRTKVGKVGGGWIEEIRFQRPQEIPLYLADNYFDIGITGQDWLANWEVKLPVISLLPISRTEDRPSRIVLAVPEQSPYQTISDLPEGSRIATEYGGLAKRWFKEAGRRDCKILPSFGNTEHKIDFGAQAIIDITETGRSLAENGLKVIDTLMETQMAVVANENSFAVPEIKERMLCLADLMAGAMRARDYVRVEANVPADSLEKASAIMVGLKAPTIGPLAKQNWYCLTAYVDRLCELEVINNLRQIGVKDIAILRDIPLIMC